MLIKNVVTAAFSLLILAGCSMPDETGNEGNSTIPHTVVSGLPDTKDGFTGIIVYGDRGYTGLAGDRFYPNVRVNGAPVGKCKKRKATVVPLAAGQHVVSAHSENNVRHVVDLESGQVAFFRCSYLRIGGIVFPPAVLEAVERETASSVLRKD